MHRGQALTSRRLTVNSPLASWKLVGIACVLTRLPRIQLAQLSPVVGQIFGCAVIEVVEALPPKS